MELDGAPIDGPDAQRGVIFQDYGVFPWLTVRDNIGFGLRLRGDMPKKTIAETADRAASRSWACVVSRTPFRRLFPAA